MAKIGDMRVWWIPQIPMKPFYIPVDNVSEAVKVMNILAGYDKFQFENRVKPDYSNAGGLQRYVEDNGEGPGWEDWYVESQKRRRNRMR